MRKISVSQIQGTETLAKPIYDGYGRVLLAEGIILKLGYKMRLTQMGILSVYINDKFSEGVIIEDFISESTRQETKAIIKNEFHKYTNRNNTSSDEIMKRVDIIIEDILSREEVILNISDIKSKDQYLYEHSVSVCALSVLMGVHLGYNQLRLRELAVGALLHDLGKLLTPEDIINKSKIDALTDPEMSILKTHPLDGYEILNEKYDISYVSKAIILMHHEYCNGTGYPLSLREDSLHETVRLVSICNTFDNLTSDFHGSKNMDVYEALEYITAMGGILFDKKLVQVFTENVAAYPSGTFVKLNTGYSGIVLRQNKDFPARPIIKLFFDKEGNEFDEPQEIDLSTETTLFIVQTLEKL